MPHQPVAEIHPQRKGGDFAIGEFLGAHQKTANSADKDAHNDGERKEIARRLFFANDLFSEFHAQESAEQAAHDGLGIHQLQQLLKRGNQYGVFQVTHQSRAHQRPKDSSQHDRQAVVGRDRILLPLTQKNVVTEGQKKRQILQNEMDVDGDSGEGGFVGEDWV